MSKTPAGSSQLASRRVGGAQLDRELCFHSDLKRPGCHPNRRTSGCPTLPAHVRILCEQGPPRGAPNRRCDGFERRRRRLARGPNARSSARGRAQVGHARTGPTEQPRVRAPRALRGTPYGTPPDPPRGSRRRGRRPSTARSRSRLSQPRLHLLLLHPLGYTGSTGK